MKVILFQYLNMDIYYIIHTWSEKAHPSLKVHDPSRYNTYFKYNPSYCLVRLPSVDFRVDPARFMQQPGKIRVLAFTGTVVNRALPCHLGMEWHLKLVNKRKTFCYIFIVLFLKFVSFKLIFAQKIRRKSSFYIWQKTNEELYSYAVTNIHIFGCT